MPSVLLEFTERPDNWSTTGQFLNRYAADPVEGNHIAASAAMVLIVHNAGASAETITITSVPDDKGRTGDVDAHSIPAGDGHLFMLTYDGWADPTTDQIALLCSSSDLKLDVINLST